jgi:hypothetical protein
MKVFLIQFISSMVTMVILNLLSAPQFIIGWISCTAYFISKDLYEHSS